MVSRRCGSGQASCQLTASLGLPIGITERVILEPPSDLGLHRASFRRGGDGHRVCVAYPIRLESIPGVPQIIIMSVIADETGRPRPERQRLKTLAQAALNADVTVGQLEAMLAELGTSLSSLNNSLGAVEITLEHLNDTLGTLDELAPRLTGVVDRIEATVGRVGAHRRHCRNGGIAVVGDRKRGAWSRQRGKGPHSSLTGAAYRPGSRRLRRNLQPTSSPRSGAARARSSSPISLSMVT